MSSNCRVKVAVEAPQHAGLDDALDYLSEQPLAPGTLVRAPLGKRELLGIVWPGEPGPWPEGELKRLAAAFTDLPPLDPTWQALVSFASGYYQRSLGELALSVLPPELHKLDAGQLDLRLRKLHKALSQPGAAAADTPPPPSPEQAEVLAQLQALQSAMLPVTPLVVAPRALDVPGVKVIVDAQGWVAKRYDGKVGTTYLLRPDQHVAARWRQLNAAQVQQAVTRATCN